MKRTFSLGGASSAVLVAAGTGLIAATYGLVRFAYGLFLPDAQADLGFAATTAGLISGGASAVYCLGALAGFLLAARRPRALVVASVVCAGGGAVGMAVAPQLPVFALFAVLSSAGAGLASPALVDVVRRNVAVRAGARGQTVVNAGTGPGLAVAGLLALALLPGWRTLCLVAAVITLVFGVLVLVLDRDPGAERPARQLLPPPAWFRAHRRSLAATLLMGAGSAAVWTYGRTLLVDAGADDFVSVAAWIALGIGGTAVIATARWTGGLAPRTAWAVTVGTAAGASAVLALAPGSAPAALAACLAFGWGYTAGSGALIAWTTELDETRAATGTALLFIALVLGQALGAGALGPLITLAGYPPAFLAAVVACLGAAALAHWPGRPSRSPVLRPRSGETGG